MPTPNKGEQKKDFIKRCIPYMINNEGREKDQATAMCYSLWEQHKKGKSISLGRMILRKTLEFVFQREK